MKTTPPISRRPRTTSRDEPTVSHAFPDIGTDAPRVSRRFEPRTPPAVSEAFPELRNVSASIGRGDGKPDIR